MPEDQQLPLYSTREDDPRVQRQIDDFIVTLAESIDALQDAEVEGELQTLGELAQDLARRAEPLGYPDLVGTATVLARACRDGKAEDAQAALVELTAVGQRVRQGHRGSA